VRQAARHFLAVLHARQNEHVHSVVHAVLQAALHFIVSSH